LNRADLLFQNGRYYKKPILPSRTGKEAAGVVEAVGPDTSFKTGDRVAILPSAMHESLQGGFAEYVVAPQDIVVPNPAKVPDELAGGIWMQYLTAWAGLGHTVKVRPGQHVVITAASSSVGIAAIQLVKLFGGVPIATTTSASKIDRLKEQGAAHVIDVSREDYVERVREITANEGVDVVFDAVAGAMMRDHIRACKRGGWILVYGVLDTTPMDVNPGVLIGKAVFIHGHSINALYQAPQALRDAVERINRGLDQGELKLVIDRQFPLDQIREALEYMLSNRQFGKIVVNP
jgi:NADPH:quinone reductase-like Zn-dependent oxidoreductase